MNPAQWISPLQQIEAFIGTVRAEIRAGVQVKSAQYSYDFAEELPQSGGRWTWEEDDKPLLTRLSLASLSTANELVPDIPDLPR